jgi:hypothetical protein
MNPYVFIVRSTRAEFVGEMRDALRLRPTGLAKFGLRLSVAGLNPSGASNLGLKQRTERPNERAGG